MISRGSIPEHAYSMNGTCLMKLCIPYLQCYPVLRVLPCQAIEEAERQAKEEAEAKLRAEEEQKAQEELERKAAEESSSATGQIRASLEKDDTDTTVKLLNSFTVENGPAQRMSYLLEVSRVVWD